MGEVQPRAPSVDGADEERIPSRRGSTAVIPRRKDARAGKSYSVAEKSPAGDQGFSPSSRRIRSFTGVRIPRSRAFRAIQRLRNSRAPELPA